MIDFRALFGDQVTGDLNYDTSAFDACMLCNIHALRAYKSQAFAYSEIKQIEVLQNGQKIRIPASNTSEVHGLAKFQWKRIYQEVLRDFLLGWVLSDQITINLVETFAELADEFLHQVTE